MSDRDRILGAITQRTTGSVPHPGAGPRPARADIDGMERRRLFMAMAREADASLAEAASPADVPKLVAQYLRENNLPSRIRLSPDARVSGLDWASQPMIETSQGPTRGADAAAVTPALAGIAETGTIALASGPDTPATLNFLPETHIVVIDERDLVGGFEELWAKARTAFGWEWPRTLNLVTGPSRSADIEQTMLMGAHGPKRLHIILVHG
jgi:L-lactate dehydrogenase complex protein LldG